jgi:hypothetical protein
LGRGRVNSLETNLGIQGERKEVCKLDFLTVEEHQCVVLRVEAEYDSTLFSRFFSISLGD